MTSASRRFAALSVPWTILLALFASTAFRIDEPNIIAIGQRIVTHPTDPYGFIINWNGIPEVAFNVLANPPLHPAWLAIVGILFGWSETALHLSMIPFSILALWAVWRIAENYDRDPMLAMLLVAVSPGFLVSSMVVMPDITMYALFLLAVAFATTYAQRGGRWAAVAAFAFGFLTPLFKYNGLLVGAVLAAIWITSKERRWPLFWIAGSPGIGLAVWSLVSWWWYGQMHFFAMASFESGAKIDVFNGSFAVFGLAILPMTAHFLPAAEKSVLRNLGAAGAAVLMFSAAKWIIGYPLLTAILFGISVALTVRFLISAFQSFRAEQWRSREVVLMVWLIVVFLFQYNLLFTSVRYMLPSLAPAVLLLLPRGSRFERKWQLLPAAGLVIALAVAIGDARTANVSREYVAEQLVPLHRKLGGRFFFDGHWGFQYYAQKAGGEIVQARRIRWQEHDLFATAINAFPRARIRPANRAFFLDTTMTSISIGWPIHTVDCRAIANFHANVLANCDHVMPPYVPWALSTAPSERFQIYVARPRQSRDATMR